MAAELSPTQRRDSMAPFVRRLRRRDDVVSEEEEALHSCLDEVIAFPAGADLVSEGDRTHRSMLMVSGFSVRYRVMSDGTRQIMAIHLPGDFVDLHSFLLKDMDHSVAALSPCTVATFPHERLHQLTIERPHLTRMLWLMTLIDAAMHREWLVGLGRRTALARTAHLICELFVRLDVIGLVQNDRFQLPITQVELADTLGLSSVHVNRTIQQLRAQELLSWQGGVVTILDWSGLRAVADFDALYLHLQKEPR